MSIGITCDMRLCGKQDNQENPDQGSGYDEYDIMAIAGQGTRVAVLDGDSDMLDHLIKIVSEKMKDASNGIVSRIGWAYRGQKAEVYHLGSVYSRELARKIIRNIYISSKSNLGITRTTKKLAVSS